MKRHITDKSCEDDFKEPSEITEDNKKSADAEISKDSWAEDQRGKSYYYDDSYGYEIYDPDEDQEDD